jgi:hypothetical protein
MRAALRRTLKRTSAAFVLLPVSLVLLAAVSAQPGMCACANPIDDPEAMPLSTAIIDDVTIGLMSWQQDAGINRWIAIVKVSSAAELPVRFVAELITLTAVAGGGETPISPLPGSTLPCSLSPGERTTITLRFQLEPAQKPVSLTIGLEEVDRSGAHVVFPLGSGTGASNATGGDGAAGANATGGDATGADAAMPGLSTGSATPAGQSSPSAGPCAD